MIRCTTSLLGLVQLSAPAAICQTAGTLRDAGKEVIDPGLGEPDFDTPALTAAIRAKFIRDNVLDFSDERKAAERRYRLCGLLAGGGESRHGSGKCV